MNKHPAKPSSLKVPIRAPKNWRMEFSLVLAATALGAYLVLMLLGCGT